MSAEPSARGVTRRGFAVMLWALVFAVLSSLLVEQRGLAHVQGVVWPSDLYAFQQVEQGPVDVAILGSSRAAFGLVPTVMDHCLAERLDRPVHSVNISRAFTTAYAADMLAEGLLRGPRKPTVLILAIEPEFFDENNPRISINVGTLARLADIPAALATVKNLRTFFGVLRPLVRGPETLALYLSGRWDSKPSLRWLMLHHGGGLFCSESEECRVHNRALEGTLEGWWDVVATHLLPRLEQTRFPDYTVGTGPVHAHAERLLAWAEAQDIQVVLVELPRLAEFEKHIPKDVGPAYQAYLQQLRERHPLPFHPAGKSSWTQRRNYYVDGEHFNAAGATRYSREVCQDTIAPLLRSSPGPSPEG